MDPAPPWIDSLLSPRQLLGISRKAVEQAWTDLYEANVISPTSEDLWKKYQGIP